MSTKGKKASSTTDKKGKVPNGIGKSSLDNQDNLFELKTIEVKFKDRSKYALSVDLVRDQTVIEKIKKTRVDEAGVLKWDLQSCSINIDFNALAVHIKEVHFFKDKDLVYYKILGEDVMTLFRDHTKFPKVLTSVDKKTQAVLNIHFGGIVSLSEVITSTMDAVEQKKTVLDSLGPMQGFIEVVMNFGGVLGDLHPAASAAMSAVTLVYDRLKQQQETHGLISGLLLGIVGMLPFTDISRAQYTKFALTKMIIKDILVLIKDVCDFARKYVAKSAMKLFFSFDDQEKLAGYNESLKSLKESYDRCINREILQTALSLEKRQALGQLRLAPRSQYDSTKGILSGTRENVMQIIMHWVARDDDTSGLFWLSGVAGCGKTAIANTFATTLEDQYALAGSFFCKYDAEQLRDPFNVLPSLAYGLAVSHKPFADFLIQALESDPEAAKGQIATQFKKLFKDPLAKMGAAKDLAPDTPYIFVIDAVDECGNVADRTALLECLCEVTQLVPWLKVFITSRPLPDIQQVFKKATTKSTAYTNCELSLVDAEQDITVYTRHHISEIVKEKELDESWPGVAAIRRLTELSKGLFIWISTVMNLLKKSFDAAAKLKSVLGETNLSQSSADAALDNLYTYILKGVLEDEDAENVEAIKWTLVTAIATTRHSPVSPDALSPLMPVFYTPVMVKQILKHLQAVMTIDKENGNVIRVIHPSFMDFVVDKNRCPERFWVDPEFLNVSIATKCFEVMFKELKFNICGLETSYLPNKQVSGLSERVEKNISMQLRYSCLYWSDHLLESGKAKLPEELQVTLETFVQKPFILYWIETLSLMELTYSALTILDQSSQIQSIKASTRAIYFDLHRFVHAFYDAISTSTPHLYVSAVVWVPRKTYVAQHLQQSFSKRLKITGALQPTWPVLVRDIDPGNGVLCVACSPNGQQVACGFFNGSVTLWAIKTGVEVCAPLQTGIEGVQATSVAFSPDGIHITAGYSNGDIFIWDTKEKTHKNFKAHNGGVTSLTYCSTGRYILSASHDKLASVWYSSTCAEVGDPLEGHTDVVTGIAASPDDKFIATSSLDGTVRIWDFNRHSPIGEPLSGHKGGVYCVTFSKCGNYIATGGKDETVILWDAQKRVPAREPMTGHKNWVMSVAFTMDGKHLASGSTDETIKIWDLETGSSVGDPLYGPRGSFMSVAYTSDGQYLVSGVDGQYHQAGVHNGEICIWDAKASTSAGDSPVGLGSWVLSVSCSPDGTYIAAGMQDHILTFETLTGVPLGSPMKEHKDWVTAVAHSPCGKYLASGSRDGMVFVWDMTARKVVVRSAPGHKEWVNGVAYSPDGKHVASASSDKTVCIWDTQTGAIFGNPLSVHTGVVHRVAYSPSQDGASLLASCSDDSTIIIWNVTNSTHAVLKGHEGSVNAIVYTSDGKRLASCSSDNTVRIWDTKTYAVISKMVCSELGNYCSIAFSRDEQYISAGATNDTYCIWDISTGELVGRPLIGHNGWITTIAFTIDGNHMVTGSIDHTVRLMVARPMNAIYQDPSTANINQRSGSPSDLMECFVQAVGPSYSGHELKAKCRVPADGWIRTASGGLMLWIPQRYRKLVVDRSWICFGYETIGLDCRRFSSGTGWADMKPIDE